MRLDCRVCGRKREPAERFSARGKCTGCGEGNMLGNRRELRAHSGPFFDSWRVAVARSVGAILADELDQEHELEPGD